MTARALIDAYREVLERHRRVVLTGRPGVGKTTLAAHGQGYCRQIFCTDILAGLPFDDQPRIMLAYAAQKDSQNIPWVIEGVMAARVLRKGLKPDAVFVMLGDDRTQSANPRRNALATRCYAWVKEASALPIHRDTKFYYYDTRLGETNV